LAIATVENQLEWGTIDQRWSTRKEEDIVEASTSVIEQFSEVK
jgi:hypothetical protein